MTALSAMGEGVSKSTPFGAVTEPPLNFFACEITDRGRYEPYRPDLAR